VHLAFATPLLPGGLPVLALEMHGDPADRIMVGTALQEGCKLVTRDVAIVRSGIVETVWD
jgi:PIN domain nuclease of toxin-antitoxin system